MEKKLQLLNDGQAVLQDDVNALGETAGLADDRVFAELFRMAPTDGSTSSKGILPYAHATSGASALIAPNGASGSVLVGAFRALVGSRTAVAANARENWRDIRSGLSVLDTHTALTQSVSLAANASGNPRWDAIYALVAIDANSSSVTRKVKDPATGVVADASVVVTKVTNVTLGVVTGTTAASPVWPALPSDSSTSFYILLGYVRVPTGFTAGSTVLVTDIAPCAPALRLSRATGGASMSPGTSNNTGLSNAQVQAWGSSGTRPKFFIPTTMTGAESLLLFVDLTTGSESHAVGAVLDSRDWRNRIAKYIATANTGGPAWHTTGAVWPRANTTLGSPAPGALWLPSATAGFTHAGMGNTFVTTNATGALPLAAGANVGVALIAGDQNAAMPDTSFIQVVCDSTDGHLYLNYANAPNVSCLIWIDFSGVY